MTMSDRPARRRRAWLRACALAVRVAVAALTLASGILGGLLAANKLGRDSPFVWTVAILSGFAVGVFLMGNTRLQRVANRLEQTATMADECMKDHKK
jgi:hypothetical protein